VNITVTMTNSGPTCEGNPPWFCGQGASVYNSGHSDIWDWGAGPDSPQDVTSCPAGVNQTIAHDASSSEPMPWHQDQCTFEPTAQPLALPNPDCSGSQVPDGTYTVIADSGKAQTVGFTISGG